MSSRTNEDEADVFPWMRRAIIAGVSVGILVAVGLACVNQRGKPGLVVCAALGTFIGAFAGAFVALHRTTEVPAALLPAPGLWDPWLDSQTPSRDDNSVPTPHIERATDQTAREFDHWRTRVRPRVISPLTGESLPLTDVIGPLLQGPKFGLISLVGRCGSGKTTALKHLAGLVPPHLEVAFLDEPTPSAIVAAPRGSVIFTSDSALQTDAQDHQLKLSPWGEDEWIEYLLATDHRLCGSVMARLRATKAESSRFEGIPELWVLVLDRMLADPSLPGPGAALKTELAALMPVAECRDLIERACFAAIAKSDRSAIQRAEDIHGFGPKVGLSRLVRHRPVQLLLAADHIWCALKNSTESEALGVPLPRDLVHEAASRIAGDVRIVARLRSLITIGGRSQHPMVASLLHALRLDWQPVRPLPRLAGAYLENATWAEIDLAGADLRDVDLSGANLHGSRLDSAILERANLAGADLSTSSMEHAKLDGADLGQASLDHVRARGTRFRSARLVAANLGGANFDRAIFEAADLSHACVSGASLVGADLRSARIDAADFSGADLSGADLQGLTLRGSVFARARFKGANLAHCNLEELVLPGAFFEDADLRHALLTGSQMRGANFRGASLRSAGLAEIDWEGADLRSADLRQAVFHLGSSRSGLVGSPIASEGSRTGFYTDDWREQGLKSPEEIRKANLCGADLRGARIDDVDFYLVDLRGAHLDPKQIPHIRRCGAILEARA